GASTGGVFDVSPGAVLDLTGGDSNGVHYSGNYTGSGGGVVTVGNGRLDIDAGGATFNFPAGMFQWGGGDIDTTNASLTNTGAMIVGGGRLLGNGTFFNAGTITGGGFAFVSSVNNNTTFDNKKTGKYTAPPGSGWGGNGTFVNAGTLTQKGASTATSIIFNGMVFSNTGTVSVTAGTLSIQAPVAQISAGTLNAGVWTVSGSAAPATLNITSANFTTLGTKAKVTLTGSQASFTNLSSLATMLAGSSLTLSSGAALTTNGGLTNSGLLTLNAGCVLTVNGAFTEGSTATLTIQLGGTNSAPSFGKIVSAGPVSLAGKLTLKETSLSLNYTSPATLQFITNTGAPGSDLTTGNFANLPEGAMLKIGAMTFTIHYGGGDGNDVTLTK
ncbi:MAG TPA: hypothetical protein VFA18_05915, partial [Gemmataceae bacterium]|nr:hypothetical protein [Gemmataceae bacterium]